MKSAILLILLMKLNPLNEGGIKNNNGVLEVHQIKRIKNSDYYIITVPTPIMKKTNQI